jgi:hypothetical protein
MPDELLPEKLARREFGSVSAMCFWRWRRQGILPPPIVINKRNYWYRSTLQAAIGRHAPAAAE